MGRPYPVVASGRPRKSRKVWSTCLRTGEAAEFSQRVRNAQGDYRWFLSRAEPLRASDGTLLRWVGVNLDIEELKCAEQALRESEGKFRDYAETASDWLWEIGPDYKFTLLTENAFGSNAADEIGTAAFDPELMIRMLIVGYCFRRTESAALRQNGFQVASSVNFR